MKISSILLRKAAQKGLLKKEYTKNQIVYKVLDTEIVFKIENGRLKKIKEPSVNKMKSLLKGLSVYRGWQLLFFKATHKKNLFYFQGQG